MRFMLLTPGTGHFYCGSCLRDDSLARALRRLGHDVDVVPLYLPLVLEDPVAEQAVQMGGINMYLQQKSRLAGYLPRVVARLLDRPGLLRWASRRGNLTDAASLGEMTVSMLRGEHGRQHRELDKLVEWASAEPAPDVIVLSNIMLVGVARQLKQALRRPVIATLQGEAPFLDALPAPFAQRAWQELRGGAAELDGLVAVSRWYAEVMCGRLELAPERVQVIHNGIAVAGDVPARLAARAPLTVGYLARMCRDKGLPTLVDAFVELKRRPIGVGLRLAVAGVMLGEDRALVAAMKQRLAASGLADDATFHPNVDRDQKAGLLASMSVLSVPATYGESFGLYLLEAWAAGVPVVQPRHGSFPELIEATGGGLLCAPDDPVALAHGLEQLLGDPDRAQQHADRGRRAVLDEFTAERMAEKFVALCATIV